MSDASTEAVQPNFNSEPELVDLPAAIVAVRRETVPMAEVATFYDRAYALVTEVLTDEGIGITGPAVGIYYGTSGETADIAAGFPCDNPVTPAQGVTSDMLPAGRAAQILHTGPYDQLPQSYDRMLNWLSVHALVPGPLVWETYLTEPSPEADPNEMLTLITWPLTD